jgi:hypothetical protein
MKLERGLGMQHLVDLGNGVRLDCYWPESNPEPFFYLSQSGYQAPLKPDQIRPLIEALEQVEELLWAQP